MLRIKNAAGLVAGFEARLGIKSAEFNALLDFAAGRSDERHPLMRIARDQHVFNFRSAVPAMWLLEAARVSKRHLIERQQDRT